MNKLVITAAMLAALPLSTTAANLDAYLKLDGIKGDSAAKDYKDQIDVLSWSWGMSHDVSTTGTGSGTGKTVFQPFSWMQGLDRSFVPMFSAIAGGEKLDFATLSVQRTGDNPQAFFTMNFKDVRLTSLTSNGNQGGAYIAVSAALVYDAIEMSYRPQNKDGSLGTEITGRWDVKQGKAAFAGDPGVMRGLAEAGGNLNFVSGVPEPATWALLAGGLGVIGLIARRRRQPAADAARDGGTAA